MTQPCLLLLGLMFMAQVMHAQKLMIRYPTNKYLLTDADKRSIDSLLATVKSVAIINLGGYTDDTGSDTYNQKMSIKRVSEVLNYLHGKGILNTQVEQNFYGRANPLVPNSSTANRAMNRRTEISILSNAQLHQEHAVVKVVKQSNGALVDYSWVADSIWRSCCWPDKYPCGVAFIEKDSGIITEDGLPLLSKLTVNPCEGNRLPKESNFRVSIPVTTNFINNIGKLKVYEEVKGNDIRWRLTNVKYTVDTTSRDVYLVLNLDNLSVLSFAYTDPAKIKVFKRTDNLVWDYSNTTIPYDSVFKCGTIPCPKSIIDNALEMKELGIITMTDKDKVLASQLVYQPCFNNNSPFVPGMVIKVPVKKAFKCGIDQLKVYNEVDNKGNTALRWKLTNMPFKVETTDSLTYLVFAPDKPFTRLNFAYDIHAKCFDAADVGIRMKRVGPTYFEVVDTNINAVYTPAQEGRNRYAITVRKDGAKDQLLNITLPLKRRAVEGSDVGIAIPNSTNNLPLLQFRYVRQAFITVGKRPKPGYYVLRKKDMKRFIKANK